MAHCNFALALCFTLAFPPLWTRRLNLEKKKALLVSLDNTHKAQGFPWIKSKTQDKVEFWILGSDQRRKHRDGTSDWNHDGHTTAVYEGSEQIEEHRREMELRKKTNDYAGGRKSMYWMFHGIWLGKGKFKNYTHFEHSDMDDSLPEEAAPRSEQQIWKDDAEKFANEKVKEIETIESRLGPLALGEGDFYILGSDPPGGNPPRALFNSDSSTKEIQDHRKKMYEGGEGIMYWMFQCRWSTRSKSMPKGKQVATAFSHGATVPGARSEGAIWGETASELATKKLAQIGGIL